jgi:hypothetical protein
MCQESGQGDIMNTEERRLVLDRSFARALDAVLDAFLKEGFVITPVGAGDLHRPGSSEHARRYAMLEATLSELVFRPQHASAPPVVFGCRVAMFELTDSCTLVTVEPAIGRYPALATLVPRVPERIGRAVRTLMSAGALTAA